MKSPPPILLVIEDEQAIVDLLATLAAPLGLQVAAAQTGKEALDLLRHLRPALATLDLVLPDIDGFAVLEQIRQRRDLDDLPVIVVTAINDPTAVRGAYTLGASDFVSKPFNVDLLEAKLRVFSRMRSLADELRQRERFLEEVVDHLSSGLVVCDAAGRVLRLNAAGAAQLGIESADEAVGKRLAEFAPGAEAFLDAEGGDLQRRATVRVAGQERPLGFSTTPLDAGGVVAVFRELSAVETARREAAERARHQALARAARAFAHEVRNPIAAVSAASQMLARDDLDATRRRLLALAVESEVARVAGMVAEYVERQTPPPPTGAVDLRALLEQVMEVNLLASPARARVALEVVAGLPRVRGDEARLKQVVLNLVQNAIAATVDGDRIEVRAAGDRAGVALIVSDTGSGIAPSDLPRIFDESFSTRGGDGLGLPIARRIVEEHGGQVRVESAPGKGTTFTVLLPVE